MGVAVSLYCLQLLGRGFLGLESQTLASGQSSGEGSRVDGSDGIGGGSGGSNGK